jgi:glycerophosphoryl diester phosphodiesterase
LPYIGKLQSEEMTTRPLLLGHRGARAAKSVKENTLPCFDLCLEHGCDGFEFDVRLSGNGEAVICHDARIHGQTVARASSLDLNLPTLGEVLERYSHTAFLNIELKVTGLERQTVALLRKFPPQRGCVVSSFLPGVLTALNAEGIEIPLGLICENQRQLAVYPSLPIQLVMMKENLATASAISRILASDCQVVVWTVNREVRMRRFLQLGVAGIISDQTALLARVAGRTGRRP